MRKLTKLLWLFSLIAAFSGILYAYASFPETISYQPTASVSRDQLFYLSLAFVVLSNFGFYAFCHRFEKNKHPFSEAITSWLYGFALALNIFCMAGLLFLNLYNGDGNPNLGYFGTFLYLSLGLVGLLVLMFPIVMILNRKSLVKS